MAAGVPVVLAGRNPGYESVMHGFDDLLFRSAEPDKIAQTLVWWLEADDSTVQITSQKLKDHVAQYDIEKVVGPSILETYYNS